MTQEPRLPILTAAATVAGVVSLFLSFATAYVAVIMWPRVLMNSPVSRVGVAALILAPLVPYAAAVRRRGGIRVLILCTLAVQIALEAWLNNWAGISGFPPDRRYVRRPRNGRPRSLESGGEPPPIEVRRIAWRRSPECYGHADLRKHK